MMKVVVFDFDETLGYFSEFGAFFDALEASVRKTLTRETFYKVFDVFAKNYLRPNILTSLRYLREKKKKGICSKVIIYTNNNGPRKWVLSIKGYLEYKLNYKLFDRIISAYKIGAQQIESCRTSHDKSYKDLLSCARLSKTAKICFVDDFYHPKMVHNNVHYIQLTPYRKSISFTDMTSIFLQSTIGKEMITDKDSFKTDMHKSIDYHWHSSRRASGSYLPPTENIMKELHYFLYKF